MVGILRDFKLPRRRRQRECQTSNWLNKKNNNPTRASRFLYISLQLLHDYDEKMPNFTFYGGRKQATEKFSFSRLAVPASSKATQCWNNVESIPNNMATML